MSDSSHNNQSWIKDLQMVIAVIIMTAIFYYIVYYAPTEPYRELERLRRWR